MSALTRRTFCIDLRYKELHNFDPKITGHFGQIGEE